MEARGHDFCGPLYSRLCGKILIGIDLLNVVLDLNFGGDQQGRGVKWVANLNKL